MRPPNDVIAPSITLVICTRDRPQVGAALESALASDHDRFEVVLIDQSVEPVWAKLSVATTSDSRLRYLHTDSGGLGRARNLGLHEARAELVAFTDDDCTVPATWVSVVEASLGGNLRAAMVFTNVKPGPHDEKAGFIPAYERTGDALVSSLWGKRRARGIGAGMAVRRAPALDIGGFDERLGAGSEFPSCEDGDLAVRFLLHDWTVLEVGSTSVTHHGFRTWEEGRELGRRNWIGIGAAYAKPLKCGRLSILLVLGHELSLTLRRAARHLRHGEKPHGLGDAVLLLVGVMRGLRVPIDRRSLTFARQSKPQAAVSDRRTRPAS